MKFNFILNPNSFVTVFINGKTYTVKADHPNFKKVKDYLKTDNHSADELLALVDIRKAVETQSSGKVKIVGSTVQYDGKPVHSVLTTRIITMLGEGFGVDPMLKFMDKLYTNPSYRAVNGLYDFLEATNIPLTPEGNFLAYKKVRSDYLDIHSGTMDNSVGKTVSMPRSQVNEDPDVTCSSGLHVCSESYLPHFGGYHGNRVVICEVNPANVVAIPRDYNNAKMRVCEYKVIGEVPVENVSKYFDSSVVTWDERKSLNSTGEENAYAEEAAEEAGFLDMPVLRHEEVIAGQTVVFTREDEDSYWYAAYAEEEGHSVEDYCTYADELDDAIEEIRSFVETRYVYTVQVVGLTEYGEVKVGVVTFTIDFEADEGSDIYHEAAEAFTEKDSDVEYDTVRVRSFTYVEKEVLV